MTITLTHKPTEKILEIRISGKIHRADYSEYGPQIERIVREHGKTRVLIIMEDFHGWDMAALWEDLKFEWSHFSDSGRVALVGDKSWEKALAMLKGLQNFAEMRFFTLDRIDEARQWLQQDQ